MTEPIPEIFAAFQCGICRATKPSWTSSNQRDHLFGNLVVVASERDSARPPRRRQIHSEREIDVNALLTLTLEGTDTDDAIYL